MSKFPLILDSRWSSKVFDSSQTTPSRYWGRIQIQSDVSIGGHKLIGNLLKAYEKVGGTVITLTNANNVYKPYKICRCTEFILAKLYIVCLNPHWDYLVIQ